MSRFKKNPKKKKKRFRANTVALISVLDVAIAETYSGVLQRI